MKQEKRARFKWACRRGMLELDLLLERFCQEGLETLNDSEQVQLETLLALPDPDLLACLMGYAQPTDKGLCHVVARIQSYIGH